MFGFVAAVAIGAIVAEVNFEQCIANLPADTQARLRANRREWQEALRRQAEDAARHSQHETDKQLLFLTGLALGAVLS